MIHEYDYKKKAGTYRSAAVVGVPRHCKGLPRNAHVLGKRPLIRRDVSLIIEDKRDFGAMEDTQTRITLK